ncbi:hypothetical protein H0H81_012614 [Sphagnurus paluster]|uniref:Uncharacterized protein n=1 Tax=Sphagnurus paluster TaxID=117069 RepID=A0A9P7GKQ9_9AGAR|nr:hypothetical protein H0H81_012614 [Sphagnurus paluster]
MPPPTELDALVVTETYAQDTRPVLAFIIVSSLLAAILLPLLGLLIAQSTSRSRRTTFFALNVIAVCLGILDGILCIHLSVSRDTPKLGALTRQPYVQVTSLLSPFSTLNPVENFMYTFLSVWVPWITEAILLFRVVVVYRSSFACLSQMLPLLAFPIIVKVARAVCNIIFLVHRKPSSWQPNLHAFANAQTLDTWPVKVTWVLEFVDNLYVLVPRPLSSMLT